uniref:hypothetical protein n=1 Tax=Clostridioides sp. ES-S-0173-01 TaxID=2770786 RepID=UPI001E5A6BD7|nr:hypothetical protein [Clostridioides sp. ES-S-0173-01]UDN49558.1 hypothetical protein JJJ25_19125 [Clostridioides sp. ES-S-0173-01]
MNDDEKTVKENTSKKHSIIDYIKVAILLIFLMILPVLTDSKSFANIVGVQIFVILVLIINIVMKNDR